MKYSCRAFIKDEITGRNEISFFDRKDCDYFQIQHDQKRKCYSPAAAKDEKTGRVYSQKVKKTVRVDSQIQKLKKTGRVDSQNIKHR